MIQNFALRIHKLRGRNSSKSFKIKGKDNFCVHKICGSQLCKNEKVPNNIHAIEERLRERAEKLVADKIEKEKKRKRKAKVKNTK